METAQHETAADWHSRLFHSSILMNLRLRHLRQIVRSTSGAVCLDIGDAPAPLRRELRRAGGTWTSVSPYEDPVLEEMLGENVVALEGLHIPLGDDCVDVVVVQDMLEKVEDDYAFVQEVHRVLKPNGILIVCAPNYKKLGLAGGFRNLLGFSAEVQGLARSGYTQGELYDVIKDGFDITSRRNYSRFFTEFFDTILKFLVSFFAGGADPAALDQGEDFRTYRKAYQISSLLKPFHWLVSKIDILLFWTAGYHLIVKAHSRPWKPRRTVRLRDGRSISDATINTKIGTAAPF